MKSKELIKVPINVSRIANFHIIQLTLPMLILEVTLKKKSFETVK